jgi:hypothetical protein
MDFAPFLLLHMKSDTADAVHRFAPIEKSSTAKQSVMTFQRGLKCREF